jgi:tRNA modification GTPase
MESNILFNDTICALGTPPGVSAISCIRLSGSDSRKIVESLVKKEIKWVNRKLILKNIPHGDEVLLSWFKAPNSYTGEDVVEIFPHGSPLIIERILNLLTTHGARLANAGEFSYRAVLNKKLTIEEAELINGRINAKTPEELKLLDGNPDLNKKLEDLLDLSFNALADIEADIEFQEGIDIPSFKSLCNELDYLYNQSVLTAKRKVLPKVLLYGPPNCGKSTLFNHILGYQRSIVNKIPGTTRDYIESEFKTGDTSFVLIDSAGVRKSRDEIEEIGVNITESLFKDSHVVVSFDHVVSDNSKIIKVEGKIDNKISRDPNVIGISGKTGEGVQKLLFEIVDKIELDKNSEKWDLWVSTRVSNILKELKEQMDLVHAEVLPELKSHHLMKFCENLRTHLLTPPHDLYGAIFSKFCIGK